MGPYHTRKDFIITSRDKNGNVFTFRNLVAAGELGEILGAGAGLVLGHDFDRKWLSACCGLRRGAVFP